MKNTKNFTTEQITEILRRVMKGEAMIVVAEEEGIAPAMIGHWFQKAGIRLHKGKIDWDKIEENLLGIPVEKRRATREQFKASAKMSKLGKFGTIKQRDSQIVLRMMKGRHTLEELGKEFGLSRERIRQIYTKKTGKPYQERMHQARERKIKAVIRFGNEVKFNCKGCGKDIKRKEVGGSSVYCTDCRLKLVIGSLRDKSVAFICEECGESFNPPRNWQSQKRYAGKFCNPKCYLKNKGKKKKAK